MKIQELRHDSRPIQSIVTGADNWWKVGRDGVTKIEPYGENGQMSSVDWLAVFEGDALVCRVNCTAVEYISYKQ